jgi:type I restriction enzyme S subunit
MIAERLKYTQLQNVVTFKNGKSIKPNGIGEYPVYGSNGIIGGSDVYSEENAIIIGRVGAYCGSIAYQPNRFWASDNTIVAYPRNGDSNIVFLSYLLTEMNLHRWAGGAAQPLLTQSVLNQIEAPIPPLQTQRKIAAILSAYDDLIENNLRRIKILEEMAQNLYREWFVKFRFPGYEKV